MGCSKGSSSLALYAQRLPGVTGRSLSSRALVFLYEDLLGRAAGFTQLPMQPSHQRQLEKGSLVHPQYQQHLALSAASRAFGSTDPFLSYLLWPEGLQCCPLELLWAQCWPMTT